MKSVSYLLACSLLLLLAAIVYIPSAKGQIHGTLQGTLVHPASEWNYGAAWVQDYSTTPSTIRTWWSCGKSNNFYAICYGENNAYVDVAINASSHNLCDIADVTVVQFKGMWYLYAGGIPNGDPAAWSNWSEANAMFSQPMPPDEDTEMDAHQRVRAVENAG